METQKTILWIIIGILLVAVIYVVFFKGSAAGNAVNSNGQIDMTGWTENEIMNYQMHGIIPAKYQGTGNAVSSNNQMVGGC